MLNFLQKRMNNEKGFTLIELIVVIGIIGILAVIAVPRVTGFIGQADDAAVQADIRTIENAVQMYLADDPENEIGENFSVTELSDYLDDDALTDKYDEIEIADDGTVTIDGEGEDE